MVKATYLQKYSKSEEVDTHEMNGEEEVVVVQELEDNLKYYDETLKVNQKDRFNNSIMKDTMFHPTYPWLPII